MTSLLIDLDEMRLLKKVEGENEVRRCEYWADILIPKNEFYVTGTMGRDLSKFTLMELQLLYNNEAGSRATFKEYSRAIELVKHVIDQMKPAEETVGQLVRKLGKPLKEQSFTPVKEKPEPKSKQSGGIPTRPKAGTMTARVWEAADWLYSQQESKDCNAKSLRDEVVKVCVDNGVNGSTASTQFAKWKKALNAG